MAVWVKNYQQTLERLIQRRLELGWTQDHAAQEISARLVSDGKGDFNGSMLGKMERGHSELSLRRFLAICEAYRSHPMSFIDPDRQPAPEEIQPFLQDAEFLKLAGQAYRLRNRPKLIRFLVRLFKETLDEFY